MNQTKQNNHVIIFAIILSFSLGSIIAGRQTYWVLDQGRKEISETVYEYILEEGNENQKRSLQKDWHYNYNIGLLVSAATGLLLSILFSDKKRALPRNP